MYTRQHPHSLVVKAPQTPHPRVQGQAQLANSSTVRCYTNAELCGALSVDTAVLGSAPKPTVHKRWDLQCSAEPVLGMSLESQQLGVLATRGGTSQRPAKLVPRTPQSHFLAHAEKGHLICSPHPALCLILAACWSQRGWTPCAVLRAHCSSTSPSPGQLLVLAGSGQQGEE